jgi:glycosyltransferase involved in cell wall biosynthesis
MICAQVRSGLDVAIFPSLPIEHKEISRHFPDVHVLKGLQQRSLNPWLINSEWINQINKEFGTPDITHFHSTYIPSHIAMARQLRSLGWPYIVTPHGGMTIVAQGIKKIKKTLANLLFFRSFIRHATAIHAISPQEEQQIRYAFPAGHVFTIPNGVNNKALNIDDSLPPANLEDFRRDCDLLLGFVGRIDFYVKGLDLLLHALASLKTRPDGVACKLFLVGPYHTRKDKVLVSRQIRELKLENDVKVLGPKFGLEKWRFFLACDIFVYVSRTEAGVPQALLEAMALGRPCLASKATGLSAIAKKCGGWVCDSDPWAIAEAIVGIYRSQDELEAISNRCSDYVRSEFSWDKISKLMKQEYTRIVERLDN